MAKNMYVGIQNKARKIKSIYVGVNNIARRIKTTYTGIGRKAKNSFSGGVTVSLRNIIYSTINKQIYYSYIDSWCADERCTFIHFADENSSYSNYGSDEEDIFINNSTGISTNINVKKGTGHFNTASSHFLSYYVIGCGRRFGGRNIGDNYRTYSDLSNGSMTFYNTNYIKASLLNITARADILLKPLNYKYLIATNGVNYKYKDYGSIEFALVVNNIDAINSNFVVTPIIPKFNNTPAREFAVEFNGCVYMGGGEYNYDIKTEDTYYSYNIYSVNDSLILSDYDIRGSNVNTHNTATIGDKYILIKNYLYNKNDKLFYSEIYAYNKDMVSTLIYGKEKSTYYKNTPGISATKHAIFKDDCIYDENLIRSDYNLEIYGSHIYQYNKSRIYTIDKAYKSDNSLYIHSYDIE